MNTRSPAPLTETQLEELRSRLVTMKQQFQQELAQRQLPVADMQQVHDRGEESVNSQNTQVSTGLRQHVAAEITLIDAALARINAGSCGICIDCGNGIGFERLQAYPMARRCIACKQAYEQGR